MDARHCAGAEMQDMMAYAASVGSAAAKREGAKGFVGNANDGTAHWFGAPRGFGTMPHSLIGYAGSTVRAAEMFHETFPDEPMTVLVDYFGREITDALAVCARFPDLAAAGRLSFRLDTHGGRFIEGLDPAESYAVLERHAPGAIRRYRSETELRYLVGTGVSAAAIWRHARGARCGRLSARADRRLVRIRRRQVPRDGRRQGADRRGRHRQFHPRRLARDLRHRRHRRVRRRADGEARPRVPAAEEWRAKASEASGQNHRGCPAPPSARHPLRPNALVAAAASFRHAGATAPMHCVPLL